MVGAIERIAQEIAALDKATSAIADELYGGYSTYLTVLGQAVRQQLILASYHVCTQGYPESFAPALQSAPAATAAASSSSTARAGRNLSPTPSSGLVR